MTASLVSALFDGAFTRPPPGHDPAMSPRHRALHGDVSLAQEPPCDPGADNGGVVASEVELAGLGTELLAIPEVALIVIAAGLLASAVWACHPHLWQLGAAAAAALAAAAMSLPAVSPTPGALLLLLMGTACLAMEVYSLPGLMLHAAGGATAVGMAGLCLHGPWSGAHPGVAIPAALVVGLGTWSAARRSWRASRADPWVASARLVGRELVVLGVVGGNRGHAVVAGQLWAIRDPRRTLVEGSLARVTELRGDELLVQQRRRPPARPTEPGS